MKINISEKSHSKAIQKLGIIVFWLGWPGLWLLSRFSKRRTRVIIVCGNQVLFIRDWIGSGKFGLPGGGIKIGEDPKTCALRELLEETGVDLQPNQLKSFRDFDNLVQSGMKFHCLAYYAKLPSKPVLKLQPYEIVEAKWIQQSEFNKFNINSSALNILEAFSSR